MIFQSTDTGRPVSIVFISSIETYDTSLVPYRGQLLNRNLLINPIT